MPQFLQFENPLSPELSLVFHLPRFYMSCMTNMRLAAEILVFDLHVVPIVQECAEHI